MKEFPDKYFDLAIVDPPYGIKRLENPKGRLEKYGDTTKANNNIPTEKYFDELFRVSKNQIIWAQIILICPHVGILYVGININQ